MTFRPLPPLKRFYDWGALVAGWLVLFLLVTLWSQRPFSFTTYIGWLALIALGIVWGLLTYRAVALARMRYSVDRNALRVRWGWSTLVVPMPEIIEVHRPGSVEPPSSASWWRWPAPHVWRRKDGERTWYAFATRPLSEAWIFCGADVCLAISPEDGEALLREVNRRRALGANRRLALGWEHPRLARWRIWQDTYALLGWLAGVVFLVLIWGEAARRADLPTPQRLAELSTLVLAVDWILGLIAYRRERLAALLLWWTGSVVLAVLLIGLWTSRI